MLNRLVITAIAISPAIIACGPTYIENSLVDTSSSVAVPAVEVDNSTQTLAEHLEIIDQSLDELSDAIVDNDGSADAILTTLLRSWDAIEDEIKTNFPDSHFGFYEVITLAELSVERRRPADASKAWKLFIDIAASVQ